jgi:peptidoglycan/xylan/chitin deacetylase (PgdA/CDA1 family)
MIGRVPSLSVSGHQLSNATTYIRSVPVISSVTTKQPFLALTFDDGPMDPSTDLILDALAKEGAYATFFVRGSAISSTTELTVKRAVREGHEIGNHTHSHFSLDRCDDATLREEIERTHHHLETITGEQPTVVRPPYGHAPDRVDLESRRLGYRATILWSIQTQDWVMPPSREIVRRVLDSPELLPGAIILLHDGCAPERIGQSRQNTVEAVRQLLPELREMGFKLVTVSQLLDAEENNSL